MAKTSNTEARHVKSGILKNPLEHFETEIDITSQLFLSALGGQLESLTYLVANGVDVITAYATGEIVFDFGILSGNLNILKYIFTEHACLFSGKYTNVECLLCNAAVLDSRDIARYSKEVKGLRNKIKSIQNVSLLCAAIAGGNFDLVKYLIEYQGVPVISTAENCPLCTAILVEKLEIIEYLLDKGANIDGVCDFRRPLLLAAQKSSLKVFTYLLERGACFHVKFANRGVFDYAAYGGNLEVLKYLIDEKGFKHNIFTAKTCLNTFLCVCLMGTLEAIKYFVEEKNISAHQKGPSNNSILHEVAACRNVDIIRYFVEEHGLSTKAKNNDGYVPLFYAIENNNVDVVKYFLEERKLSIRLTDKWNRTVLHLAVLHGDLDLVKYLIEEQNADLNAKNYQGETPLLLAAKQHPDVVLLKYLINQVTNIFESNNEGINILHLVSKLGNVELIEILVAAKGMPVNTIDFGAQTPIIYAAKAGNLDAVQYFIESGQYLVHRTIEIEKFNETLFASAFSSGNLQLIKYLIEVEKCRRNCVYLLHHAAAFGNMEIIKTLVEIKGIPMNIKEDTGETAIFYAAKFNRLDAVIYFVNTGNYNINAKDVFDRTILLIAVECGYVELFKYLVAIGADLMMQYYDVKTCIHSANILHYAARLGNVEIIRILVEEKGKEIHIEDSKAQTPIFYAAESGRLDAVIYFVEYKQVDINIMNPKTGDTILLCAVRSGNTDLIKYLLEMGADLTCQYIDLKTGASYTNILHHAVRLGNVEIIKILTEDKGMQADLPDSKGQTPLFYAVEEGRLDAIKYLVEYQNVEINAISPNYETILFLAVENGHINLIKYLLEIGADIGIYYKDPQTDAGCTNILHHAARLGNVEILKILVEEKGMRADLPDTNGHTPLFYAAERGSLDAIKYLVKCPNVDINAKNRYNETILLLAVRAGHEDLVEYLIKIGADLTCQYEDDETGADSTIILHHAARLGSLDIIKQLVEEKDVPALYRDSKGKTPHFYACKAGEIGAAKYFVQCKQKKQHPIFIRY